MNKMAFLATAAAAAFVAAPASAATTINLVPVLGTLSGAFGNAHPHGSGTDVYNFTVPSDGSVFGYVGSIGLRFTFNDLDFTSVTLNGVNFDINSSGWIEDRTITLPVLAGVQTLSVSYKNAQRFSSYGGFVSFTAGAVGAVPEPATWALMILGMGGIAGAMRHRRRTTTTVRFA
ncbi:FxDxF family PEP-CTERM protein [uncultured Sphingomonas sp.]|uniref:FxDxF family PEP-CTERM protein n=1 Tax=uncultured Sphingomonas sp. TaxID=158754 RepID=UPI002626A053|nr:FxDxF family PEP-CTERM protein [uncultured Sphingomonas sp.]